MKPLRWSLMMDVWRDSHHVTSNNEITLRLKWDSHTYTLLEMARLICLSVSEVSIIIILAMVLATC